MLAGFIKIMSMAPSRVCCAVSTGEPRALLGKIVILTSPLVRSLMRFTIFSASMCTGCEGSAGWVSLSSTDALAGIKNEPMEAAAPACKTLRLLMEEDCLVELVMSVSFLDNSCIQDFDRQVLFELELSFFLTGFDCSRIDFTTIESPF